MLESDLLKVKELLQNPKKITLIPHRNPDGDAMGSCLGLFWILTQMGHTTQIIAPNEYPDFLNWMPGIADTVFFESENSTAAATTILKNSDLIFTLDFNALHRVGKMMEEVLQTCTAPFIMIDHHVKPDDYAVAIYSDTSISSTCEMVYRFIHHINAEHFINPTVATCLYTGIVTDTGSFKYASTSARTHQVAADLIHRGIENGQIHNQLFDNNSLQRLAVLGRALQNIKILPQHKTSYCTLSQKELDELGYKKGDTEGIVNYGLSLKDVIFTAFFTENKKEDLIKISFRSIGDFDVNQFARAYFEGGGHKNAAGGKSSLSLEETINRFVKIVKEIL
jgi:bifunctional oligoribonuclease and PAP phosphatase NrnA